MIHHLAIDRKLADLRIIRYRDGRRWMITRHLREDARGHRRRALDQLHQLNRDGEIAVDTAIAALEWVQRQTEGATP